MIQALVAALLLIGAQLAHAHSEPIDPSTCTLSPLELSAPGAGLSGSAAAPGSAHVLREVYDASTGSVTFCTADPVDPATKCATSTAPRSFTMGTVTGTLAFPLSFKVVMLATGDLTIADLPLTIDTGGGPVVVPFVFTTGLVSSAGGGILEGSPIAADGAVAFVGRGTGTGLAPPLADQEILLRGSCTLNPKPDLDQFPLTPTINKVTGRIKAAGVRLKLAVALQPGQTATFPTNPATVRLHAGDATLAEVTIPGGLAGTKHKFEGTGANGATMTVHAASARKYVLAAKLPAGTIPDGAHGKMTVDVTQDVGGLLSRATRTFKANKKGTLLHAP